MLRTFHKIVTILIIVLGVIHLLFTPIAYSGFSTNAMWFSAAGLTIIFTGFLNVALIRLARKDVVVLTLTMLSNLSCLVLFICAILLIHEPQVYFGIFLFSCATAAAFQVGRTQSTQTVNNS